MHWHQVFKRPSHLARHLQSVQLVLDSHNALFKFGLENKTEKAIGIIRNQRDIIQESEINADMNVNIS